MEDVIRYQTEGAILRSKVKWYNEGERNTKYFHSLEQRHFNCKTIRNLKTKGNARISEDTEILDEAKKFYESLYSSRIDQNVCNTIGDKIKRILMINDYSKGGLKMLDVKSFNDALKAKWVQRYLDPNNKGKWKLFLQLIFLRKPHYNSTFLR